MKVLTIQKEEIAQYPNALDEILDEQIDGIIIKNAFSHDQLATTKAFFTQKEREFPNTKNRVSIYSMNNLGAKATDSYLASAQQQTQLFKQQLAYDLEADLHQLFTKLSGYRVQVPQLHGQKCAPFTVRRIAPTAQIPAHVENEMAVAIEGYQEFAQFTTLYNSLSYFILLEQPEAGGELVLFDLRWENTPKGLISKTSEMMSSQMRDTLICNNYDTAHSIRMEQGDLIVFAGGRVWHKVTQVQGKKPRYTIGGFIATSKLEENVLHYWS